MDTQVFIPILVAITTALITGALLLGKVLFQSGKLEVEFERLRVRVETIATNFDKAENRAIKSTEVGIDTEETLDQIAKRIETLERASALVRVSIHDLRNFVSLINPDIGEVLKERSEQRKKELETPGPVEEPIG